MTSRQMAELAERMADEGEKGKFIRRLVRRRERILWMRELEDDE